MGGVSAEGKGAPREATQNVRLPWMNTGVITVISGRWDLRRVGLLPDAPRVAPCQHVSHGPARELGVVGHKHVAVHDVWAVQRQLEPNRLLRRAPQS